MNENSLARFAPLLIGLFAILFMVARGCKEGPFGRPQIIQISPEEELLIGRESYQKILSQSRVLGRCEIVDRVRGIGKRLARATHHPKIREILHLKTELPLEWEFNVLESSQINAFCLPGGKVAVYTGIIPVAQTDDGLAVVMGHEIGHALARHGAERMAQSQLVQTGQLAVANSLGHMDPQAAQTVMGLMGAGAQYGVLLPFSRSHESEADHIGILLMAIAGYNPAEAPNFWDRMKKATGNQRQPEFLSTHPSPESRQQHLADWYNQEAKSLYLSSDKAISERLPTALRSR